MDGSEPAGWTIQTRDGPDLLLSTREVLTRLRISENKYHQLVRDGVLKRLQHNGVFYVREMWIGEYWDHLSDLAEADRQSRARERRRPGKTT